MVEAECRQEDDPRMEAERRRHPRQPATLLVQYVAENDGAYQVDYLSDVSRGGIFIRTQRPLEVGSTLQVHFSPSRDAELVHAFCRVARTTPEGMAAQFVRLDADSAELMTRRLAV